MVGKEASSFDDLYLEYVNPLTGDEVRLRQRLLSLLRFVPPSRQGRKKSRGKKKAPYPWTACVVIRRKDLSIFPYIPPRFWRERGYLS
jgi:hypothetical protein